MGQTQFLVIIISVFIIGIAILAGAGFFDTGETDASKRAIVTDINQIAHIAIRYYTKPAALGGGGHSYVGFVVPGRLQTNLNGSYRAVALSPTALQIIALSNLDTSNAVIAQIDTYGKVAEWSFTGEFE